MSKAIDSIHSRIKSLRKSIRVNAGRLAPDELHGVQGALLELHEFVERAQALHDEPTASHGRVPDLRTPPLPYDGPGSTPDPVDDDPFAAADKPAAATGA